MDHQALYGNWALILGASSGFGAACARSLAKKGMNIIGVHLDRKAAQPQVDALIADLEGENVKVKFFNTNAADVEKMAEVLDTMANEMGDGSKIRVMLHSLAFGTLKPFIDQDTPVIAKPQMDMTVDVMAHSMVYWAQEVQKRGMFGDNSRIYAMTSSGGTRVWKNYGAVSAAKAALESHVRQLALEFADRGVTVNAIRAGVTDTPALRKIPGHENMVATARERNPAGRLTTPEDVAECVAVLSEPGAYWLNGNVLGVDGGEDITG